MKPSDAISIMTKHYLICAEWADKEESLTGKDIPFSNNAINSSDKDCQEFYLRISFYKPMSLKTVDLNNITHLKQLGHDFWLTRNHNGAGFWDGKTDLWSDDDGQILTEICQKYFDEVNIWHNEEENTLNFE